MVKILKANIVIWRKSNLACADYMGQKKYNLFGMYKITYEQFHKFTDLVEQIKNTSAWFVPVDIENHWWWIKKFKIEDV